MKSKKIALVRAAKPKPKAQRSRARGQPRQAGGGLLTNLADAAEMIIPFTPFAPAAPFIKPFRKVMGFDERIVSSDGPSTGVGSTGGTVVQTMNAPAAFARNAVQTGVRTVQRDGDSQRMWVCDLVGPVGLYAGGGAPAYGQFSEAINPLNGSLFPNFYTQFEDWERWRPVNIKLHYAHFAPTSTQGAGCLAINLDAGTDETSAINASFSGLSTLNHSVVGSVYEDFGLSATPDVWKQGQWLYNDDTVEPGPSGAVDTRLNNPGFVIWGSELGTNTANQQTGLLYVEMIFDVAGRRTPLDVAGLSYRALRLARSIKDVEERLQFIHRAALLWEQKMLQKFPVSREPRTSPWEEFVQGAKVQATPQPAAKISVKQLK